LSRFRLFDLDLVDTVVTCRVVARDSLVQDLVEARRAPSEEISNRPSEPLLNSRTNFAFQTGVGELAWAKTVAETAAASTRRRILELTMVIVEIVEPGIYSYLFFAERASQEAGCGPGGQPYVIHT
jgi:hypothetical protein